MPTHVDSDMSFWMRLCLVILTFYIFDLVSMAVW